MRIGRATAWVVCRVAGVACIAAMAPRPANAALSIGAEPGLSCAPGEHFFDLVFTETGPAENEGLFAYDVGLSFVPLAPGGEFSFTGAEQPAGGFVLDVPGGAAFRVATLTPTRLVINVASDEELADVNTRDKAARVFYTIGAVPPAVYTLAFDTADTSFISGDPTRPFDIPVDLRDFGVVVCPEPGGVMVLAAAAGWLALGRRRRRR